jgi:zinc carboxypeptidase
MRRVLWNAFLACWAGLSLLAPAAHADATAATPAPAPSASPAPKTPPRLLAPLSFGELAELPPTDERVPRPEAVLGYPLGDRFTPWDRIQAYFDALAASSPRVKEWSYGETYEGRPLKLVAVSSPENLARLEQLREERLRLADPGSLAREERERLVERLPLVVWLAYGVHGNEASSSEAAMAVAYVLAAGAGEIPGLLRNTIVLIDPLVNPDGRERYVHSFAERRGAEPNPRAAAAEHWEPWPGGRQNHYLVDLNRDWAWASQQETRQRLAAYRAWEPQVYVDFHEMGPESSYFFPPPAEPVHPQIPRRIVNWLDTFGRANAQAFDRQGWVYFKGQSYDLFYPGYGDSYPSLRGAVGMTYEMAGGGHGGVALTLPDGSPLTLADRVARHFTTSLATVKTAAAHGRKILADFVENREGPPGPGRTYLWSADRQEARALADLLTLHGIRVRQLGEGAALKARRLAHVPGVEEEHRFPAGTYAVSTAQPLGTLAQVLLDYDSPMGEAFLSRQRRRLEDNLGAEFYDITAWSLPLAFNLEAWVTAGEPAGLKPAAAPASGVRGTAAIGVLVRPQGLATYRLAAALQKRGFHYRVALTGFTAEGVDDPSGTLFIPRHGNPADFDRVLGSLLAEDGLTAQGVASSYDWKGLSLGSREMAAVRPVRAGLVSGDGIDPTSFGFLWSLLDRQIGVRHDRLDLGRLDAVELGDLDVLILPDGEYDRVPDKTREALDAWIQAGGELVAVGDAVTWLAEHQMTTIKKWEPPKEKEGGDPELADSEAEPGGLALRPIATPGAAVGTRMQANHPLTVGLEAPPAVLVEGSLVLKATGDPQKDVLLAQTEHPVVAGFAFPEAEQRLAGSLLVGVENRGRGSVVLFAQNPAFRLFWRATTPIFLNALLYGPSAGLGAR